MTKLYISVLCIIISACSSIASAQYIANDSTDIKRLANESIFPEGSKPLSDSHFTWGAEIGGSIDMTGNNLSTFNIDAFFGYKNPWIRTLAVGAGVHRAFGNANMFIPVYAMFRSSFRSKPSILFFSSKFGYSFNTIEDAGTKGGFKANIGLGINLAMSRRFRSHVIIACEYFRLDTRQAPGAGLSSRNVFFGNIAFGVSF